MHTFQPLFRIPASTERDCVARQNLSLSGNSRRCLEAIPERFSIGADRYPRHDHHLSFFEISLNRKAPQEGAEFTARLRRSTSQSFGMEQMLEYMESKGIGSCQYELIRLKRHQSSFKERLHFIPELGYAQRLRERAGKKSASKS